MILVPLNLLSFFYWLEYGLFHEHLKKMCILLLLKGDFYIWKWDSIGFIYLIYTLVNFILVLVFNFQKFGYIVSWYGFVSSLSCLEFTQFSRCMFLIKFLKCQPLFLQIFFSPTSFHLSFWDSNDMSTGCFVIVPQVPEGLFMFSQFKFSLFRLGEFYCSVLKFTTSILCHLHYTINLSSLFFSPVIIFFSSVVSIWFSF